MEAKISIVIPAYNAAEYLPECLDSALSQSMRELEIILIDDGSTDDTSAICDRYAGADSRIRVIHKKNAGVSAARNTGIENATGEYIWFVDADDIIEPGACAELYKLVKENNADIAVFDYSRFQDGLDAGNFTSVFSSGVYESDDIITVLLKRFIGLSNEGIHKWIRRDPNGLFVENPALWRTLLRSGLIRDNNLRFDSALHVGEDTLFLSLCLSHATRAFVTHNVLYRQRLHSASTISRYEKNPEAKLANKLALLAARHALTADIDARCGINITSYWQGTVVMSYMELCFMYAGSAHGTSIITRHKRCSRYMRDPLVLDSIAGFHLPRRLSVRSIPFMLMKWRLHRILFLCAALLGLVNYQFQRE